MSSRVPLACGGGGGGTGRDGGVCLLVHRHPVPRFPHRNRLERRVPGHLASIGGLVMSAGASPSRKSSGPIIELTGVSMRFRQQAVLRDITLRIERGQTVCVIG